MQRIFYKKIYTHINDEVFIDSIKDDVVYSNNPYTGNISYQYLPGVKFVITFNSYTDFSYYDPEKKSITKIINGKSYDMEIHINIEQIKFQKSAMSKLLNHFLAIQREEICYRPKLITHHNEIKKFINCCNNTFNFFTNINHYRIDENNVYDFNRKRIIKNDFDETNKFIRKGGIIRTNSPFKLVKSNFIIAKNTLVIIPSNMTDIWQSGKATIITFDNLLKLKRRELVGKKWDQIIIHECYVELISGIRNLLKKIDCKIVWIINTLPTKYYFPNEDIPVDGIFSKYLDFWMKKEIVSHRSNSGPIHNLSITKFIYTKLGTIYTKVSYPNNIINERINIRLNTYEKMIHEKLGSYYDKWKSELTNEGTNKYSFGSHNRINMMDKKLFNGMLMLNLAIVNKSNIDKIMQIKTNYLIDEIDKNQQQVKKSIDYITKHLINKNNMATNTFKINFVEKLKMINEDNNTILNNYQRYLKNSHHIGDENCPICYEPLNEIDKTMLICGHQICLDCIFHSLANNNECPICREHINLNKIILIKENYSSMLHDLCRTFDSHTVVLTNYLALQNINHHLCNTNIFDVNNIGIMRQIKEIACIKKVFIINAQNIKNDNCIGDFIGYFNSFNVKPIIIEIMIE